MDLGQFIDQVYAALQNFGTLSVLLKASVILTLLISAWKVSVFQPFWNFFGNFKAFVPPTFMVGVVVVQSLISSGKVNWNTVGVAIVVGLTSAGFHDILCDLKSLPGVGPLFIKVIDLIEAFLGGSGLRAVKIRHKLLAKLGLRKSPE